MILGEYCSPPVTLRMIPSVEVINLNLITKGGAFWKFFSECKTCDTFVISPYMAFI